MKYKIVTCKIWSTLDIRKSEGRKNRDNQPFDFDIG